MAERHDPPGSTGTPSPPPRTRSIRVSAWNLLLLVPLLMLITAWFNADGPRLFGWPFFYWYQMLFVIVGVVCVAIVYVATRHVGPPPGLRDDHPPATPADLGDEGELR